MWIQIRNHGIFLQCVLPVENYFFCIWKDIKACFLGSAPTVWIFKSLAVFKWICSCMVCPCIHKDHLFYFPVGSGLTTRDLFRHSGLMPHGFQLLGSYQTLPTLAMLTAGHYQVDTGLTAFYWLMLTKGEICLFFTLIARIHILILSMQYPTRGYYTLDWKNMG